MKIHGDLPLPKHDDILSKRNIASMSQYPLFQIQTLSFVKGRMMTHYTELTRKDGCLSDHSNRFESSSICTFLSFQSHWRHPLPLKGEPTQFADSTSSALLSHLSCLEPVGVFPRFCAALERRILPLIRQLFSNLVLSSNISSDIVDQDRINTAHMSF